MRHETKKICRIVDELITFLLKGELKTVDFKVRKFEDKTLIEIIDYNTDISDGEIRELIECFNVQRQHEFEEYYWQLVGESDQGHELTMIGAMIDEASIVKKDNDLHMKLIRLK